MEKAKQAVSSFLSKDGKHDTTVHETVNPAVTNEHVTRTQHENANKAVDREVHQDHYHTSVQPVKDKEVLPEQHTHNLAATQEREFRHGDDSHIKDRLAREQAQFKSTREVGDVQRTQSTGKDIVGEHIHHHVHENIQPVVQKETVQPSVVHTTIPVHEVHHNESKHHTSSALPAMSMSEFKKSGGHLNGREERVDEFRGEPRGVDEALGTMTGSGHHSGSHHNGVGSTTGSSNHHTGTGVGSGTSDSILGGSSHRDGGLSGTNTSSTNPLSSSHHTSGTHQNVSAGHGTTDTRTTHGTSGTTTGKPSLLDKLNPKKDTDGDGKAGIMD